MDTELKKMLCGIYESGGKNSSFFNLMDAKVSEDAKIKKKLKSAIENYAQGASDEEILFLLDDTVFGSATEGVVLTDRSIYWKELASDSRRLKYSEILKFEKIKQKIFEINQEKFTMHYIDSSADAFVRLVKELAGAAQYDVDEVLPESTSGHPLSIDDYPLKNVLTAVFSSGENSSSLFNLMDGAVRDNPKIKKKLSNAIASYGRGIEKNELPLFLLDSTVLGSATDGCVITDKAFYTKIDSSPIRLEYADISSLRMIDNTNFEFNGQKVFLNGLFKSAGIFGVIINVLRGKPADELEDFLPKNPGKKRSKKDENDEEEGEEEADSSGADNEDVNLDFD